MNLPNIIKSQQLYSLAEQIIPAGTQTLAKGVGQHSRNVSPIYIEKGKGSHVWDIDGSEYLDMSMAVGPVSLGYCYDAVDNAIKEQLEKGITFSLMHPLEYEVAELISAIVPNAEMVRFSKTGADVTSAAIRLARAYTGRDDVLCCGYHGWHDWYISVTDRNAGIPQDTQNHTYTFDYNNIQSLLQSINDKTAAVILEPMTFTMPQSNFLQEVREVCNKHGAVLIFDEMWTGWRLALGGAQEYFGVNADMVCFSKAIANGMPLSVLCGIKPIMKLLEKDVFFFTTFGGETLSLAAAKATIKEMELHNVPEYLQKQGNTLYNEVHSIIKKNSIDWLDCVGNPVRTMLTYNHPEFSALELKTLIHQELLRYGILWNGFHTMSFSHNDSDIERVIQAYSEILPSVQNAVCNKSVGSLIKGELMKPVFRKTTHFNTKPV